MHNALGYAFFNMEKTDAAVAEYRKAVQLQPGYVTGEGTAIWGWGGWGGWWWWWVGRGALQCGWAGEELWRRAWPAGGCGTVRGCSRTSCRRWGSHMGSRRSALPVLCTLCAKLPTPRTRASLLPLAAWNNLGDAYERKKAYGDALAAYQEALTYAPDNKVAQARAEYCRTRLARTA